MVQLLVDKNGENTCPVCGSNAINSETCCRNCKVELETLYVAEYEKEIYRRRDYNDKIDRLNQAASDIGDSSKKMTNYVTEYKKNSGSDQSNWNYCPNCGVETSPWLVDEKSAICNFCEYRWVNVGNGWKMIDGRQVGKILSEQKWGERGRREHRQKTYLDYI